MRDGYGIPPRHLMQHSRHPKDTQNQKNQLLVNKDRKGQFNFSKYIQVWFAETQSKTGFLLFCWILNNSTNGREHCNPIYFLRILNTALHAWTKYNTLTAGLQNSNPQNGIGYLMASSTLSMRWSGLTYSPYSWFVQHIRCVNCPALQRMLTFYSALKTQPELYIVILTFNPILLCLASCRRGPLRWLIAARDPTSISCCTDCSQRSWVCKYSCMRVCLYELLRFMSLPVVC